MSLQTLVDTIDSLDKLRWGLKTPRTLPIALGSSGDGFEQVDSNYPYILNEPDNQRLGSCVANATTGIIESWIHRTFGVRVQLAYEPLYLYCRRKYWGDTKDEGLLPDEAFKGARTKEFGLIPPDSKIVLIGTSTANLCAALKRGPVVLASSVHDGWRPSNLHKVNGGINEAMGKNHTPFTNGHATIGVGTNLHNRRKALIGKNSWGPLGQGNSGLYAQTLDHYYRWVMARPVLWVPGDSWKKFRGWEKHAI